MEEQFVVILALATALGFITTGITEAVKISFKIPVSLVPVVGILIGTILGAAATFTDVELLSRIWAGAIAGLMATGIYENVIDKIKKK